MANSFWDVVLDPGDPLRDRTGPILRSDASSLAYAANTQRQLFELSVTMGVLVRMLREAGLIDVDALRRRSEQELAKGQSVELPQPAVVPDPWQAKPSPSARAIPAGDPYRNAPQGEAMATCARCGRTVAQRLTVITTLGMICDRCEARGVPR
jgi:hypothetical protein